MKKKQRTPEQKAKFNKKLFGAFMSLIFLACAVVGIWRGLKGVNFVNVSDLNAFNLLKNNYSLSNIIALADLNGNNSSTYSVSELKTTIEASGIDIFDDDSIDMDKWQSDSVATSTLTLTDTQVGALVRLIYPAFHAMSIAVDSGNKYMITTLEQVNFSTMFEGSQYKDILPASAWITSKSIVYVQDNTLTLSSSKIVAYNELDEGKSDVITASIDTGSLNLYKYSISHVISVVNQLMLISHTSLTLTNGNMIFEV